MLVSPHTRVSILLCLITTCALAQTQTGGEAARAAARAAAERIELRLREQPDDAALHFYLAIRRHAAGEHAAALSALRRTLELGDGFLPITHEQFAEIAGHADYRDDYRTLWESFERRLPRTPDAPMAYRLQDPRLFPEGVAWDRHSGRTFVGSARDGRIVEVDARGRERMFVPPNSLATLGLGIHPRLPLLCAVRTNATFDPPAERLDNQLACYGLRSARLLRRLRLPAALQLNDLTWASSGHLVWLTDTGGGTVWQIDWPSGRIEQIAPRDSLPGANGLTASGDGRALFVAHSTGVARLDLDDKRLTARLPNATRETVAAIDGLTWTPSGLLGIQNVTTRGRVIRIQLAPDGQSIVAVRTLQSHHHAALDEPTTGVVVGERFRVIANSQLSHLMANRSVRANTKLKRPVLLDVPLGNQE